MVLCLLVVVFGAVVVCLAHHAVVAILQRASIRAIREEGLPTSLQELNEWNRATFSGQNAEPIYRKAFAQLRETEDEEFPIASDTGFVQRREPASAELLKRAQEFLDGQQKVLGLLHEAAGMPGCRYTVDWTRDDHVSDEAVFLSTARTGVQDSGFLQQGVRDSVRLLCLEALVAASSGRADEALNALRDTVRMTRSLDDLPMLMTHLVIVACSNMILDTAEYMLYTSGLDSEWRVKLAECIEPLRDEDALRRAYVGERCFGLTFPDGPRSDRVPPDWPAFSVVLVWAYDMAGFGRADSLAYLKDMGQQIAAAELASSERAQAFEKNHADFVRRPEWRMRFKTNMANVFLLCEPDAKLLSRVAAVQEALKG